MTLFHKKYKSSYTNRKRLNVFRVCMWVLIGRFISYFAVVYVTRFLYAFVAVTNQYLVPVLILLFYYIFYIV